MTAGFWFRGNCGRIFAGFRLNSVVYVAALGFVEKGGNLAVQDSAVYLQEPTAAEIYCSS